ncbi:hypothetical protein Leryth_010896 [Lithospermum erythrorhizon]|nr:hypothetical protein Leryth_010896 [Lithospermum erythrorhizon]
MGYRHLPYFLVLMISCTLVMFDSQSFGDSEETILLKFKESLQNTSSLSNWGGTEICCLGNTSNWNGVLCLNGQVTGLRLQAMELKGTIDVKTLANLSSIRSLSVMNNSFSGPMPEIKNLGGLRSLYMSFNGFSGHIPDDAFAGMKGIRRIVLDHNEFSGRIPMSLTKLPKLVDLQVQNNQFDGQIPDFLQDDLVVNFGNNKFEGSVPAHLSSQNASSFYGNINLCGKPLDPCKIVVPHAKKKAFPILTITLALVGALALIGIILICFKLCCRRTKPSRYEKSTVENLHNKGYNSDEKNTKYPDHVRSFKKNEKGRLNFVKSNMERFELDDLLRAPAEVLGSGSFGSSYKADLFNGHRVVVRRFRQMSIVGREEFYEHMRRLGSLSHPNVLPLVAFYYRKEEKLLINEFAEKGSLASHLHGKRSINQQALNWPSRLKIIKGVARGLSYLYKQLPTMSIPHGHFKSSNVLLDKELNPLLADYALSPVINKEHAQQFMVAYKSPECGRVTRKTDVWSLGILILELLTGRFPANYLQQGKGANVDLATWVNSVVREEWTSEVFDKEMDAPKMSEGQMLRLLRIGMCCCEWNEEGRWELKEAVEKIEELKEKDDIEDDQDYSNSNHYGSQEEFYSSQTSIDQNEFSAKHT